MQVSRRQVLKWAGLSGLGAVAFQACGIPEKELRVQSPVTLPEDLVTGTDNWYATLCGQHPQGCGIVVRVMEGRAKKVEGNPDFPVNRGKHAARCEAELQALYHPDRLQNPKRRSGARGSGQFEDITWDEALGDLATRMRELKAQGSADTVVLATDPLQGHLALLADRFTKAYGNQHLAYEPLEQTVLRAAIRQVFGQERLPDFDLENTQFLLSFGADFLATWVSPIRYARGYGEFRQGPGRRRGTFVQVDSRFSMTAANADKWVPIKPGAEGVLALSLAYVIISEGLTDPAVARAMTGGAGHRALEEFAPERAAGITGVPAERIAKLARDFAGQRPSLAVGGGSAGAYTNGLFNLTAIYALNFLAGSVGKPGGVIFNPPPPLSELPGAQKSTPFADWQRLSARLQGGTPRPVNVLLVRGVNPVYGLPGALGFAAALEKVPFMVCVSSFLDETAAQADLVLPEHTSLESWGDVVPDPGPGYQALGFQQPVVRPLYDTRGFGDVLLALSRELGGETAGALPWASVQELLQEGARRIYELNRGSVRAPSFEAFWLGVLQRGGWWDVAAKSTAQAAPPRLPEKPVLPASSDAQGDDFYLVPFESLSLGDGRGAHLPWLQATPDPITTVVWQTWVEINQRRAQELGIREGNRLLVESPIGKLEALAYPHPAVPPDRVCIPTGQGHTAYGSYAEKRGANPLAILALLTDKETGALAWGATRVRITKIGPRIRIPKFEGTAPSIQLEGQQVIQVVRPS